MAGSSFIEVNQRIEEERRNKFCGTASIKITSLRVPPQATNPTKHSDTDSLKRIFKEEHGCRQEDIRHHVKAAISQVDLEKALRNSGVLVTQLLDNALPYPKLELPPGTRLECLQGSDRITAADEIFDGIDKRWIVDLFLDDLSEDLKRLFTEEYEHQKTPTDGEFYCKIRGYQGCGGEKNPFFERIWLGRLSALSKNRRNLLDQLSRQKEYVDEIDKLLVIPALFCGFRLTVMHHIHSMRCKEPNLHYLGHIFQVWSYICNNDLQVMRLIDRPTVEKLEGKAPGAVQEDHGELIGELKSGHIFGNFPESQKAELWFRVCAASRDHLIPSLFTFFEDRKFLNSAADCIKRIADVGPKNTVTSRLVQMFTDTRQESNQCIVQVSDTAYTIIPGNPATRFDVGCRTLWLLGFREFKELP
ncbi:hypothetical protein EDB81DRAFT_670705, partial [Dactylonectria macrodidyma]